MKIYLSSLTLILGFTLASTAHAGVIFNTLGNGLGSGSQWDAATLTVPLVEEQLLGGGLRYSLQGGSLGNLGNSADPITNDNYGIRQFLDPFMAVPEPGSASLIAVGLLALLLYRRATRRKHPPIKTPPNAPIENTDAKM